jgi:N-acetylmuramoyl-L-alanine amidase
MSGGVAPDFDFSIPEALGVTVPDKQVTVDYSSYYIMGTSDPDEPLSFDGRPVERQGTRGTWGVYVPLEIGSNSFAVNQSGNSVTVNITRRAPFSPQPIDAIPQSSAWPAIQGGVKVGGKLTLSCTAPSGGTVSAAFGGKTVTLQQQSNEENGMPATFKGELVIDGDYPANATTRAGKVTYSLNYNGVATLCESAGEVLVAGSGSYIAIRVTEYQGFVYPDPTVPSVFREKLKRGATDYVYSEDNEYFRLYSGGYIPKKQCEIIEGEVKIGNSLSSVTPYYASRREVYRFDGISLTSYYTEYKDDVFYLTLYNTRGVPSVGSGESPLFSSVSGSQSENLSVTYAFNVKDPRLYYGHNIWFDGDDLLLRFQYRPKLSADPQRPFDGITVMLDPGHGGTDPGALGVAALVGPNENLLNLATAWDVRDKLTALGADVVMTRDGLDDTFSLDERLQAFEGSGADFFIALHHNSMGYNVDSGNVTGTESYYHTWISKDASQAVLDGYCAVTGSSQRESRQDYYRVTLLPAAPSMLIELGFISNPADYERLCTKAGISKSGDGVVEGLLRAFA